MSRAFADLEGEAALNAIVSAHRAKGRKQPVSEATRKRHLSEFQERYRWSLLSPEERQSRAERQAVLDYAAAEARAVKAIQKKYRGFGVELPVEAISGAPRGLTPGHVPEVPAEPPAHPTTPHESAGGAQPKRKPRQPKQAPRIQYTLLKRSTGERLPCL
jgi:hypothetical protein